MNILIFKMQRIVLLFIFFPLYFFCQQEIGSEKEWVNTNNTSSSSLKNYSFVTTDSIKNDTLKKSRLILAPDFIAANYFDEFRYQAGVGLNLQGRFGSKFIYQCDSRVGETNQSIHIYQSNYQNKSFYTKELSRTNEFTANYLYADIKGRVSYLPNNMFSFATGIDHLFIGEGDRSLFSGNQGVANPFASIRTKFWKFDYLIVQQIWRERNTLSSFVPKGSATHYLSYKHSNKFSFGIFESAVYHMKDTLYNRGLEIEYLNPLIFYRPQEYNNSSADNIILGLDVSYRVGKTMLYGQLLLDDFLLSAFRERNGWWANKYGVQLGVKGLKDLDSNRMLFYRTELNWMRPYVFSQTSYNVVYGNQGLPVAHPLGSNFFEFYQEISLHTTKWKWQSWLQFYIKGNEFDANAKSLYYGGDIYKSYKYVAQEYGNKIGQGNTLHQIQVGTNLARKIGNYLSFYVEPRIIYGNLEGIDFVNGFFTVGFQKSVGSFRRNY